ncbi:putative Actin family, ATPase, nucleotide binding domain-containing protein [Septoria linicola]|nr:putative Actin family, ATPase, nucleotide binding domain-containing protein [Septoria linicola]
MATLPPTQAPGQAEYAGDEINALVLDPGSHSVRAGFAGEDTPKSVVPTSYARTASGDKLYGENAIHLPKAETEILNPYDAEGVVEDWETASRLWEYAVTSRLTGQRQTPPSKNGLNDGTKDENGDVNMDEAAEQLDDEEKVLGEYPLLMTEPGWNPLKAREKTMEIAMEQWGVPAFFLAKTGQLAAYSQGKATALVVDIGHQNTSVTALHEGMVLKKSIQRTPLAGNWLNDQIRLMYSQQSVPLVPHYMVKSKLPVDAGAPSNATYVKLDKPPTDSYRRLEEERVLTAFKESVVQAWPGPGRLDQPVGPGGQTHADQVKQLPPKPFEMPDGWNQVFGLERFKVAEGLFDNKAAYTDAEHQAPQQSQTITQTVRTAIESVDVDQRPSLLNNVILTGAGSLIEKLPERLQADLSALFPNPKVRVIANSSSPERKYGAWVGGSVLGSLGTFHQMWVSKQEYEEFGAKIVEKRCK